MSAADNAAMLMWQLETLDTIKGEHCTAGDLRRVINDAYRVPALAGNPGAIRGQAAIYEAAMKSARNAETGLRRVAVSELREWRGQVAETAAQVVQAISTQAVAISDGFFSGNSILTQWASSLEAAQKRDEGGRTQLSAANARIGYAASTVRSSGDRMSGLSQAWESAHVGCSDRLAAANKVIDAAAFAVTALNSSAQNARTEQLEKDTRAPDAITLAYFTDTLSPSDMTLAHQRLAGMHWQDRLTFENLVAGATSPAVAAYLWKAFGLNYSQDQLDALNHVLAPFGKDPSMLARLSGLGPNNLAGMSRLAPLIPQSQPPRSKDPEPLSPEDVARLLKPDETSKKVPSIGEMDASTMSEVRPPDSSATARTVPPSPHVGAPTTTPGSVSK